MYFREHLSEREIEINTFVNLLLMFIQGMSGVNHLYYRKLGGIFSNSSFPSQGEVGREKKERRERN